MNSTTNNIPSALTDKYPNKDIVKKAWINVISNVSALLVLIYLAWQLGIWQFHTGAAFMAIGVVVSFVGLWLIKKDRLKLGVWLILSVPMFMIFVFGLLIANLGILLAIIAVVVTTVSAGQLMPDKRQVNWAVMLSFIVALTVVIADQFNLPYQFQASEQLVITAIILTGPVLLGYGYFIWREFKNYSLRAKYILTLLTVALIPLMMLAFFNNQLTRTRLISSADQNLFALASQTVNSLDTLIQSNLDAIENEAKLP